MINSFTRAEAFSFDIRPPIVDGKPLNTTDYRLALYIVDAAQNQVVTYSITPPTNPSVFTFNLTTGNTALMVAGQAVWSILAYKTADPINNPTFLKYVERGTLMVYASLADRTTTIVTKTDAETQLDDINAAIKSIISGGLQSYTIGTRSFTYKNLSELLTLKSVIQAQIQNERRAKAVMNGEPSPTTLYARFRNV